MSFIKLTIRPRGGEIQGEYSFNTEYTTVYDLKNYVSAEFIGTDKGALVPVRLYLNDEPAELESDRTIASYRMKEGDTITYEVENGLQQEKPRIGITRTKSVWNRKGGKSRRKCRKSRRIRRKSKRKQ